MTLFLEANHTDTLVKTREMAAEATPSRNREDTKAPQLTMEHQGNPGVTWAGSTHCTGHAEQRQSGGVLLQFK